jgi:hypothetical protein
MNDLLYLSMNFYGIEFKSFYYNFVVFNRRQLKRHIPKAYISLFLFF